MSIHYRVLFILWGDEKMFGKMKNNVREFYSKPFHLYDMYDEKSLLIIAAIIAGVSFLLNASIIIYIGVLSLILYSYNRNLRIVGSITCTLQITLAIVKGIYINYMNIFVYGRFNSEAFMMTDFAGKQVRYLNTMNTFDIIILVMFITIAILFYILEYKYNKENELLLYSVGGFITYGLYSVIRNFVNKLSTSYNFNFYIFYIAGIVILTYMIIEKVKSRSVESFITEDDFDIEF